MQPNGIRLIKTPRFRKCLRWTSRLAQIWSIPGPDRSLSLCFGTGLRSPKRLSHLPSFRQSPLCPQIEGQFTSLPTLPPHMWRRLHSRVRVCSRSFPFVSPPPPSHCSVTPTSILGSSSSSRIITGAAFFGLSLSSALSPPLPSHFRVFCALFILFEIALLAVLLVSCHLTTTTTRLDCRSLRSLSSRVRSDS